MTENGFDYVDLGLPSGTMWATCNVGATKPEDEGLLFQWGRVDGYKYGDENHNFKTNYQNRQETGHSFITQTMSGKIYNKRNNILDLEDDAAHVNMGGKWMMPTNDQLEELHNNTTHKVETINGVKGMMFTSKINSNQLFIPFMQGSWWNGNWEDWGRSSACVWSSQVHDSNVNCAYRLDCDSSGIVSINDDSRSCAFSVRGVFKKIIK